MLTFHIITIFPEMFDSYLGESILKRAIEESHIAVKFYNPRDFTKDKHKAVDDKPYGGGPGMVMMVEPILLAVESALANAKLKSNTKIILLSRDGKQFTNEYAEALSLNTNYSDIILIAGRYEGVDARVVDILKAEKLSIGEYTLTGGELPAMIVVDAVTRRIKGVLGKDESVEERRTASNEVYTRPENFKYGGETYSVPEVLLSGNHKDIEEWRKHRK